MPRLLALGPSGPFPRDSQPNWYLHEHGMVQVVDTFDYVAVLVDAGMAEPLARDRAARMRSYGATHILWASAQGGRRGHLRCAWDVRVAPSKAPAVEVVPAVTGVASRPAGAIAVPDLDGRDGVLLAYSHAVQPQKLRLPPSHGPTWSRTLRLPAQVRFRYTSGAHASVAVGTVGATVNVFAEDRVTVERGLRTLVDVVLADVGSAGQPPP